jgi:ketosteroid isomerase-like protein
MKATPSHVLRFLFLGIFFLALANCSDKKPVAGFGATDKVAILQTLQEQQQAWNEGNPEKFMDGYWKSDSMQFVGGNKINYGWQTTLDNYKKNYPDTVAMGKLRFEILKVNALSPDAAFLTGRFFLKRTIGDLNGIFTLVLRKIEGKWVVVYDHTSD